MKLVEKVDKKDHSNFLLNLLLWLSVSGVSTYVVYKMTINSPEPYTSDYPSHLTSALNGTGYSIMELIMKWLYTISGNTVLISCFIGLLTSFTAVAIQILIKYIAGEKDRCVIIFSYGSLFLASMYVPVLNPYWYIWTASTGNVSSLLTQPWHNSTYVGMRLFAVLSFAFFMKCWKDSANRVRIRDLVLLFVTLSITNLFKPNFIIAFAPAVVIIMIISLISTRGSRWKEYIKLCVAGIASMFPLIIQYRILFRRNDGEGWKVSSERLLTYFHHYGGAFALAANLLFPVIITVLVVLRKESRFLKDSIGLAWITEIICFLESMLLTETGSRANDGNFSWGIYGTTLILFVTCFAAFIRMKNESEKNSMVMTFAEWLVIMHIAGGFMYFGIIFKGYPYLN